MFPENSGDFVFSLNISSQNIFRIYSFFFFFFFLRNPVAIVNSALWRNRFTHPFNAATSGMESDRQQAATTQELEKELWDGDTRETLYKALPTEHFKIAWNK